MNKTSPYRQKCPSSNNLGLVLLDCAYIYGLNVYLPPLICWSPDSILIESESGKVTEARKVKWDHGEAGGRCVVPDPTGLVSFLRRHAGKLFRHTEKWSWKLRAWWWWPKSQGKRPQNGNYLSASRTMRNKFLLFKPPSLCFFFFFLWERNTLFEQEYHFMWLVDY